MKQQIIFIAYLCSTIALVYALPISDNSKELDVINIPLSNGKELDVLTLGTSDTMNERNKRTIGILRDLFPEISKQIEDQVNKLVAQLLRTLGPTVLRTAIQGNTATRTRSDFDADFDDDDATPDDDDDDISNSSSSNNSNSSSSTASSTNNNSNANNDNNGTRVRIELPTFDGNDDNDTDTDDNNNKINNDTAKSSTITNSNDADDADVNDNNSNVSAGTIITIDNITTESTTSISESRSSFDTIINQTLSLDLINNNNNENLTDNDDDLELKSSIIINNILPNINTVNNSNSSNNNRSNINGNLTISSTLAPSINHNSINIDHDSKINDNNQGRLDSQIDDAEILKIIDNIYNQLNTTNGFLISDSNIFQNNTIAASTTI